jgi:hypothetical protein
MIGASVSRLRKGAEVFDKANFSAGEASAPSRSLPFATAKG